MGATATYELDTERDNDAQAIFERSQKIQEVGNAFPCFYCWRTTVFGGEEFILVAHIDVLYSWLNLIWKLIHLST